MITTVSIFVFPGAEKTRYLFIDCVMSNNSEESQKYQLEMIKIKT